jgi:hypothetical protein
MVWGDFWVKMGGSAGFGTILAVSTDICDTRFDDGDRQAVQLDARRPGEASSPP